MIQQRFSFLQCLLVGALVASMAGTLDAAKLTIGGRFPAAAEIIAATPEQATFGDDASTSLGQSFTVDSAFSLQTIFLEYENDTRNEGDKTVTLSIFPVADVNAATHPDPPDPNDVLLSEAITFPYVAGADTVARIELDSPLALDPGGYLLHFSGTTNPGWEWLRTGSSGGSVYANGNGYENGEEKGSGDGARDFTLALSSVPEPTGLALAMFAALAGASCRKRG